MNISGSNFFPWTFELREYDLSGTLVNTSTYITPNGFMFQSTTGLVVTGNKVLVSAEFNVSVPSSGFWTEFTISGASLLTPTATNLPILIGAFVPIYFGAYDGTNIFIGAGVLSGPLDQGVIKYSYSSPNFTTISTFSLGLVSTTPSLNYQLLNGFELPGSGTIGIYQNISSYDINSGGNPVNSILKAKYDIFTF
jgi:hypothetical protein